MAQDRRQEGRGPGQNEADRQWPLLVILGPTATGKTDLALSLAGQLPIEIISADSAMVYRMLDIGTAKPTPDEQARVPHHLIDVRDPDESFTVADFQRLAHEAIVQIHRRGRLPVVVGGTGFYIRSLTEERRFPSVPPDWALRRRLTRLAEERGRPALHQKLARRDPAAADRLHPNDMQRVIRALEIYYYHREHAGVGGKNSTAGAGRATADAARQPPPGRYKTVSIGLTMDREALYRRIHERSEEQLAAGWLEEVRDVLAAGYRPDCFGLQILGYRQLTAHLLGEINLATAIHELQRDTRHFARRQFIWFRRERNVTWLDVGTLTGSALQAAVLEQLAGQGITL